MLKSSESAGVMFPFWARLFASYSHWVADTSSGISTGVNMSGWASAYKLVLSNLVFQMWHEAEIHHLDVVSYGRRENASASVQTLNPVLIWGLIVPDGEVSGFILRLRFSRMPRHGSIYSYKA